MDYTYILAFIEAELDRLQRARQLLVQTERSTKPSAKRTAPPAALTASAKLAPAIPAAPAATPAAPAVVVLRPKRARAARVASSARKSEAAGASALSGGVPATPVFVSAENIRHAPAHPNETPGQDAVSSAPAALSPELLMQKWLHNSAN
jgi:hypothetical protein